MASLIDPLIAFVSAHAWLAYLTLFLAALLEAVPIVGAVIPGSTIIFALSALVPGGELQLPWVLLAAIAGALLGDGSAFLLGHREQREILNAWPLSNYPQVVSRSEAFFHRWGALAVFFARFVPPIRAFVPITAGALGMSPLMFYRRQHSGGFALGARPCAAGGARGFSPAPVWRFCPACRSRQALLDPVGDCRRFDHRAGELGDPPQARRRGDRAGYSIGSRKALTRIPPRRFKRGRPSSGSCRP